MSRTGNRLKSDVQPIPTVDRYNGQGEINPFFFGELFAEHLVHVIGNVSVGDARDRFRPCQCGTFAFAEIGVPR